MEVSSSFNMADAAGLYDIVVPTKGHHTRCYIVEATIKISKGSLMNLIQGNYNNQIHEQFH